MKLPKNKVFPILLVIFVFFLFYQSVYFFLLRDEMTIPGIGTGTVVQIPPLVGEDARSAKEITSTQPTPLSKEEKKIAESITSSKEDPQALSSEEEALRRQVLGI